MIGNMRNTTRLVNVKPTLWWQSKTLWFNVITAVLDILALTEFANILPKEALPYLALAQAVGNVIIRTFFTDSPLAKSR